MPIMKNFLLGIISALFVAVSAHGQTDPNWIWAKKLDANARNVKIAAIDETGNFYCFGHFNNEVELGNELDLGNGITLVNSSTTINAFIAAYDTNGVAQWAKKFIGIYITDLSRDKAGNIYICGSFKDSADLGNGTIIREPDNKFNIVTAKLDKNGNVLWAKTPVYYFSSEYDRIAVLTISTDESGNSYIGGTFRGLYSFGERGSLVHIHSDQMFVARYNTDGEIAWAWYSQGDGSAMVTAIGIDSQGNTRVGGHGRGNNIYRLHNVGGEKYDIFTLKVDSAYDATYLTTWGRKAGGGEEDILNDVAVDKEGNVFICGKHGRNTAFGSVVFNLSESHSYSLYLAKYDSLGQLLWARSTTGANWSAARAIALDNNGNAYICGEYSGITQFNSATELRSRGMEDLFIAKYDKNGNMDWVKRAGSNGRESASSMVLDVAGNLYIQGVFDSTFTLDSATLSREGYNNNFIAKFSTRNVVGIFDEVTSESDNILSIHPNPAHATSRISFKTTAPSHTRLTLTDVLGRQTLLKEETLDAGEHGTEITTANFPAGIYVLTLETGGQTRSQTIVIER
jgi:hypothetical protein